MLVLFSPTLGLTWALIDQYGGTLILRFYSGTGGNNIADEIGHRKEVKSATV
ncbi:MAG: hypothetical protein IPJ26_17420 [Bacteroidetes bacterium]|nr:hypothetical protein [Bacteroidota bacterium]